MVQEHKDKGTLNPADGIPHIYRRRADGQAMLYAWFGAMHTRVDVALAGAMPEETMLGAVAAMRRRVAAIENTANRFDPHSELSAVNRSAPDGIMPVSRELESILLDCLRYNGMTGGLFDITAGSPEYDNRMVHDIILPGDGTITFRRRGLCINLSGFLKGYALEQVRSIIIDSGVTGALINMGNSSIMAMGSPGGQNGWKVSFGSGSRKDTVTLCDQCLTTSGNDSPVRRHIVNPATGKLIEGFRSVSVVNRNAAEGEVLSTCLFIDPESTFPAFGEYTLL